MKATMTAHGVVKLIPETDVEEYALLHWAQTAFVMQEDVMRAEQGHWRGSRLIIEIDASRAGWKI